MIEKKINFNYDLFRKHYDVIYFENYACLYNSPTPSHEIPNFRLPC